MTLALDHIQMAIPAGGEDAARIFWIERVGLQEIAKPPALQNRGGCWFRLGDLELHLGVDEDFRPAKKAHPGIMCDDLPTLANKLGDVIWDTEISGRARFFTHDPFGNRLEFIQAP